MEIQLEKFDYGDYVEELNAFMKEFYDSFDDGHASEQIVNHLKSVL